VCNISKYNRGCSISYRGDDYCFCDSDDCHDDSIRNCEVRHCNCEDNCRGDGGRTVIVYVGFSLIAIK
jgi:hypothetical protein